MSLPIPSTKVSTVENKTEHPLPNALSPREPNKAVDVFNRNRVLARAIETKMPGDCRRPDIYNWDEEVKLLQSENGRRNTCCTLVVAGESVGTYKPFGMLFDAQTAQVFRAATHDISSYVDNTGEMPIYAEKGSLENLELGDLETYIKATPVGERASMNEVNAHFKAEDLLGLFVNKMDSQSSIASLIELQVLFIQRHLKVVHGVDLPLFTYDSFKGTLSAFDATSPKVHMLLVRSRSLLEPEILKYIANTLDFDVVEKGRIIELPAPTKGTAAEKENNANGI